MLLLDHAFHPRSITVVGASANRAKWANILFRRLIEGPYSGKLAAVNPARSEIEGVACYPSILDLPFVPDYVQVVVPRENVAGTLQDCVARGVPLVHVFSAGFGEVGGIGPTLQAELQRVLHGGRTRMIGPNSLGIYSARTGLDFSRGCHFTPGPATFISQSGSLCTDVLALGQARGLNFGKILSVGNCADLDWPDFVRYCREDKDTGVAAFYIESVRDGRALFDQLRQLAAVKPVLLLKGGRTEDGARSVVSHTGRLAGSYDGWRVMMRQAGVVELDGIEDMLAALAAFDARTRTRTPPANNADLMVIGSGGGVSVLISDAADAAGLRLATLSDNTLQALGAVLPDAEALGGIGNPVEIPVDRMFGDLQRMAQLIEVSAADPAVGSVLLHVNLIALSNNYDDGGVAQWDAVCAGLRAVAARIGKPMAVVLRNGGCNDMTEALLRLGMQRLAREFALPVFGEMREALAFLRHYRNAGACGHAKTA
ncbi:MAG: CoA-binding protein [Rhodoferax sp.]|nr:CoA-binding protein [Rhodoferax sp.]